MSSPVNLVCNLFITNLLLNSRGERYLVNLYARISWHLSLFSGEWPGFFVTPCFIFVKIVMKCA